MRASMGDTFIDCMKQIFIKLTVYLLGRQNDYSSSSIVVVFVCVLLLYI